MRLPFTYAARIHIAVALMSIAGNKRKNCCQQSYVADARTTAPSEGDDIDTGARAANL